ncbi:hypothetical protein NP493_1348g00041 [Ridgeia piscesae]|uniref:Chitin-binding type-4 domain-containing protein n=1 Tax=Ridgeia piscesae TaxID=27915 RepID=A0AAD9NDC5_RIDPI|nr:hypothetical protein NP493_1348g00041 [Ridgeia piscesae]
MRLACAVSLVTLLLVLCAVEIRGHGRLRVPPSRTSMWRDGFGTPANYNDNELFCGGSWYQNGLNGGKCGVCGDPWGKPNPQFVAGGKYANGIITRTYKEGQEIAVAVDVTAPHGGWFEFRICPNNDFRVPVTHECLNKNLLPLADGTGYRVYLDIKQPAGFKNATLRLPTGLVCTQCVLQWRWHTGNNWGTGEDGRSCIGCGLQEEFYGCADVEIVAHPVTLQAATGEPSNRTPPSAAKTTQPPSSRPAKNSPPPKEERPTIQPPIWLPDVVTNSPAKPWVPEVVATSPAKPWVPDVVTASPAKPQLPTVAAKDCGVVDGYEGNKILDRWCQVNCPLGHCPAMLCRCGPRAATRKVCKTTKVGPWKNANLDSWCARNCAAGFCPGTHCMCETFRPM